MRALVCTGPGESSSIVIGLIPNRAPGDALVKVRTVGVCGSDLRAWSISGGQADTSVYSRPRARPRSCGGDAGILNQNFMPVTGL